MKNQNISKINITALNDINGLIQSRIDSNKLNITVDAKFDNFSNLMYDIKVIVKTIKNLSLNSNSDDKDTLESIFVLSGIIQKIIPVDDVDFLDILLLPEQGNKPENFVSLESLPKNLKKDE